MEISPTNFEEVNEILRELLIWQKRILGNKLVGLYLYGSLVTGDFDIKISDIDLLCAVSSDINPQEFEFLKKIHQEITKKYPKWKERIEAQYLSTNGLRTFKTQETKMVNISPGEPFHLTEAGKDWLVNWYVVQEKGIVLFGPPPSTIIEHISTKEFIDTVKSHIKLWLEWIKNISKNRGSQAYAIITMCRAYYSIKKGTQVSKLQATNWMSNQFPEWSSLIKKALIWRSKQWEDNIEDESSYPQTLNFVKTIASKIS